MSECWGVTLRLPGESDQDYKARLQSKAANAREALARKHRDLKENPRPDMIMMLEIAATAVFRNIERLRAKPSYQTKHSVELRALTRELTTITAKIVDYKESQKPKKYKPRKGKGEVVEEEAPIQKAFSPGRVIQPGNGSGAPAE